MESSRENGEPAVVAGVVHRPRLYRILDSPLVRVCVLQGPSGSGKTTLVRSWALQRPAEDVAIWVSLGESVSSRHAFWQQVTASAKRLGDLSAEAAARVDEQLNVALDPVRIALALLADAGPVTLIFDAYERVGAAMGEIDADLARLVAALPDLRVVITTRARTALDGLDAPGGAVRVVTLSELALTSDEIGTLIAERTGIQDEGLARAVSESTRGFPLTVRAVVLALAQLGRIHRIDPVEWGGVVAARLDSLLPDVAAVQFVTDTSVPPFVDVDLARDLSGDAEAAGMLDTLEELGFGRWIPFGRQHAVFQYVETMRTTFRARAADDPVRFRRSCALTARWLLSNDEPGDAMTVAIEGGDYELADRIFVALVIDEPDVYITPRFLSTLQDVPEPVLPEYPMLAFGLGLAMLTDPILRLDAPRVLRVAIASTAEPSYVDLAIDAFYLTSMRAVALRLARDFPAAAAASLDAVRAADRFTPEFIGRHGEHVATILRQLSYSVLLGGMIDEAITAMSRAVTLTASPARRNYTIVYAAAANAFAGDVLRAKSVLHHLDRDAWPEVLRPTSMNGLGLVAEAYVCLDELDFAAAVEVLRHADPYMQTVEYWPFLTALSVSARHGLGQAGAEAERVTRILAGPTPPGTGDNVATENLHAVLARAWIAAGDHRMGARLLDDQPRDRAHLAAARISRLLAEERHQDALANAKGAMELPGHTLRTRADTWTVGAIAALHRGEDEQAWSWLNSAAVLRDTHGVWMHVATLPARDRRLLWELADERGSSSVRSYLEVPIVAVQASAMSTVILTPRETIVLKSLAGHDSIRVIAEELVVSPHTIKSQLQTVYRKLGVGSRQSALAVARELGLLERPPPEA